MIARNRSGEPLCESDSGRSSVDVRVKHDLNIVGTFYVKSSVAPEQAGTIVIYHSPRLSSSSRLAPTFLLPRE